MTEIKNDENENPFGEYGVLIKLKQPEDFLKIVESTQRMGLAPKGEKVLYQSCHILHKRGKYAIIHFKELFALDGKRNTITEEDIARRNTITRLLAEWNLLEVVEPEKIKEPQVSVNQIKIISYSDKKNWKLVEKYSIGNKRK